MELLSQFKIWAETDKLRSARQKPSSLRTFNSTCAIRTETVRTSARRTSSPISRRDYSSACLVTLEVRQKFDIIYPVARKEVGGGEWMGVGGWVGRARFENALANFESSIKKWAAERKRDKKVYVRGWDCLCSTLSRSLSSPTIEDDPVCM